MITCLPCRAGRHGMCKRDGCSCDLGHGRALPAPTLEQLVAADEQNRTMHEYVGPPSCGINAALVLSSELPPVRRPIVVPQRTDAKWCPSCGMTLPNHWAGCEG